jgi:hypothetical protein
MKGKNKNQNQNPVNRYRLGDADFETALVASGSREPLRNPRPYMKRPPFKLGIPSLALKDLVAFFS